MGFFELFRWALVLIVTVSLLPVNIPLAALAYKVRLGARPLPLETDAFWWRSAGTALGLAALSVVAGVIDHFLVRADMPAGVVHIAVLLLVLPAGVWYVFWMFALDDLLEALSVFLIFVFLPGIVLLLLYAIGFRLPFWFADQWIELPPPERFRQ